MTFSRLKQIRTDGWSISTLRLMKTNDFSSDFSSSHHFLSLSLFSPSATKTFNLASGKWKWWIMDIGWKHDIESEWVKEWEKLEAIWVSKSSLLMLMLCHMLMKDFNLVSIFYVDRKTTTFTSMTFAISNAFNFH
jgi:DUF1365 family protein